MFKYSNEKYAQCQRSLPDCNRLWKQEKVYERGFLVGPLKNEQDDTSTNARTEYPGGRNDNWSNDVKETDISEANYQVAIKYA